ncbi:hypothetical protein SAMD00019534_005850 [Acytostelium subglobosum LB1]|uniref:hypothetical protein n=1 Tax=Acytostelium subglobosum LB1 TaxID=1410327 RepID=UPI0006451B47|nr:hypothetical protein SAMD00019534_005850 [Acytostelium subglobosum LB1]GAM17410.1 hypothetical protein SAMD00019534_005850 [Acytostelium subglobosum LB1]|eukprot:XP_012759472.1 hypothetical protein SAMD00019534_005850 [Acytostelium subglobosum LB1]
MSQTNFLMLPPPNSMQRIFSFDVDSLPRLPSLHTSPATPKLTSFSDLFSMPPTLALEQQQQQPTSPNKAIINSSNTNSNSNTSPRPSYHPYNINNKARSSPEMSPRSSKNYCSAASDQQISEMTAHRNLLALIDTASYEDMSASRDFDDSSAVTSPSSANIASPPSSPIVSPRSSSASPKIASVSHQQQQQQPIYLNSVLSVITEDFHNNNHNNQQQQSPILLHLQMQSRPQPQPLPQPAAAAANVPVHHAQPHVHVHAHAQAHAHAHAHAQAHAHAHHHANSNTQQQQLSSLQANRLREGHITPLDCFQTIFYNVIYQLAEIISQVRENEGKAASTTTSSTHYLGSRFPITTSIVESFIVVSLFINSHSLDRISDYWSTEQAKVYPDVGQIPRILSRNKYFEIKSSLSSVLTPKLLDRLQQQLQVDITRHVSCANPEPPQSSRFKTPVKHRNSTKELASFNLLLEYGLSHVCDLFNQQRNSQSFIPLVQVVELLTEQICPAGTELTMAASGLESSSSSSSNSSPPMSPQSPSQQQLQQQQQQSTQHVLLPQPAVSNAAGTPSKAIRCFTCKATTALPLARPILKCSKCALHYHRECFIASHE